MKSTPRLNLVLLTALVTAATCGTVAFLRVGSSIGVPTDGPSGAAPGVCAVASAGSVEDPTRQALESGPAEASLGGMFSAAPGTALRFELHQSGQTTVADHAGAVLQFVEVGLRGELEVSVLDRRGDELALSVRLPNSTFEQRLGGEALGRQASAAVEAAFARPVLVRVACDGSTLGFRFDPRSEPEERNRMRALWGILMPVVPEPLAESWIASQADALGNLRCSYRRVREDAARVELERVGRECLDAAPGHPMPKLDGVARYGIDRAVGWFDSVSLDETATLEVDVTGWTVLTQQNLRCTLAGTRGDGPRGVEWDAAWESVGGTGDSALQAERQREQRLLNALAGRGIDELVAELEGLLAAGDYAAPELARLREQLGFLLGRDPAALERIAELVLDPRLTGELVAALIDGVGRAGTPEAQELLAAWIANEGRDDGFRTQSVLSLIELKQPGEGVVAAAAGLLAEGTNPALEGSAVLTLGALAHIGGPNSSAGAKALGHVLQWKQKAEQQGRLPEWIAALGNTGSPQVVDAVRPYLVNEDDDLRAAAVYALRHVYTQEASELAAACGLGDRATVVRGRAAEVIGGRRDLVARDAVARMLEIEPIDDIRGTLVAYLGALATGDAGAHALLVDAAATDPSAEVRQLAQQALAGGQHG